MRVLIVHPDLGVGGAERLILDVAAATKLNGNDVTILTNQYDQTHCFEDSKDFHIISKFQSMPRHLFGKFHAFFAYFKLMLASLWIIYFSGLEFDAVICDQISLPVAAFKLNNYKVLFYCHFPDQLLCVYDKRKQFMKRLYRLPLDWLETKTTGMLFLKKNLSYSKKPMNPSKTSYDVKILRQQKENKLLNFSILIKLVQLNQYTRIISYFK